MLLVLLKYGVPFADYDILVFDNACLCHKGSIHSFFNLKSALCADNEELTGYFLRLSELKKQLRMMQHKKKYDFNVNRGFFSTVSRNKQKNY